MSLEDSSIETPAGVALEKKKEDVKTSIKRIAQNFKKAESDSAGTT